MTKINRFLDSARCWAALERRHVSRFVAILSRAFDSRRRRFQHRGVKFFIIIFFFDAPLSVVVSLLLFCVFS